MPPPLIDTAIRDALERGAAVYDADVDALIETGLLRPVIDALADAGLDVRLRGRPGTLRRLRLPPSPAAADARVAADPSIRADRLRFVLVRSRRRPGARIAAGFDPRRQAPARRH